MINQSIEMLEKVAAILEQIPKTIDALRVGRIREQKLAASDLSACSIN